MARRRMSYRPSKGSSMFGGIVGIVFVIIGLTVAVPHFGLFGLLWTAIALGITVYNFYLASGKGSVGSFTVEEDGEEDRPSSPAGSAPERLKKLQELYDQRLITTEEFEEKRKEILKEL